MVFCFSAETSIQPYIDQLKRKTQEKDSENFRDSDSSDSYIEKIRKKLDHDKSLTDSHSNYIEKLKRANPALEAVPEGSYSEKEKEKWEPLEEGGAIQAVREGRSELTAKKKGTIHHAFGFRYGASLRRSIYATPALQLRQFSDVYGGNYAPDLSLFYEYQLFHSENYGSIGIVGTGGLSYFHGIGTLGVGIINPANGQNFPSATNTTFQFFTVPVTLALNYRMNLARVLRPFILAGPSMIGYSEMRNDGGATKWGRSLGFYVSTGLSFSLDGLRSAWDLYSSFGVQHYYFSVDYSRLVTVLGDVNIGISGWNAGFTFEY